MKAMIKIRYVEYEDKHFWFSLDTHISEMQYKHKVQNKCGYVLLLDDKPIGLLRYNLFWDNTPFCNMLYIMQQFQGQGYGKALMDHWESEMMQQGYGMLLTSTQVNEEAQHFYRKLGYQDCGNLTIDIPQYKQPMELFLLKSILI